MLYQYQYLSPDQKMAYSCNDQQVAESRYNPGIPAPSPALKVAHILPLTAGGVGMGTSSGNQDTACMSILVTKYLNELCKLLFLL